MCDETDSTRVVDALLKRMNEDKDYSVRREAARTLKEISKKTDIPQAIDSLIKLLDDKEISYIIIKVLQNIAYKKPISRETLKQLDKNRDNLEGILPMERILNKKSMKKIALSSELEPYRNDLEKTIKPYIKIKPFYNENLEIYNSKIGGIPYLPPGFPWPKNKNGRPLFFLAQLNFSEIPEMDSFPGKGILQFYISGNVMATNWGYDYNNPTVQENFRVLFFPEYDINIKRIENNKECFNKENPPLMNGPLALSFELEQEPVSTRDIVSWNNYFPEYNHYYKDLNKAIGTEDEDYFTKAFWTEGALITHYCFFNQISKTAQDWYFNRYQVHITHKIGGYPFFTQDDSRLFPNHVYTIQLLQLISDENLSWGDCGIAHFFIKKEDLKKRDFSNILYSWDCC